MPKPRNQSPETLGLHKHPKGVKSLPDSPLNVANLFRTGSAALKYTGSVRSRPAAIYQHQYMIFAGTTTIPVIHSVYLVEVSPLWPKTAINRRTATSRILHAFGRRTGLQLDDLHFNRAFKVVADDEDFAIALLTPEMQRFLTSKTSVSWRIDLGRIALLYSGALKDKRIAASLDRLGQFLDRIPDELEAWQ